jgi:hypothetical protein
LLQGCAKKIQLDLLATDLALKLRNPIARFLCLWCPSSPSRSQSAGRL